jgi:hypothetical protein
LEINVLPVGAVKLQGIGRTNASHTRSPSLHLFHALLIVLGYIDANLIQWHIMCGLEQAFCSCYMHDCIVTVGKLYDINLETSNSALISDFHHLFMDLGPTSIELPTTSSVAHRIPNCSQHHRSYISVFNLLRLSPFILLFFLHILYLQE